MKDSGDYLADHFDEVPLLLFVFAIDDLGGANIYPAIWSALLAARAEGVGGVMTMVLRNFEDRVNDLLGVPVTKAGPFAMLTLGYPRGQWGVAANRHPVHEVHRGTTGVRRSVSKYRSRCGRITTTRRPAWPRWDESPPVASRGRLRKSPASPSSAARRHRRHRTESGTAYPCAAA